MHRGKHCFGSIEVVKLLQKAFRLLTEMDVLRGVTIAWNSFSSLADRKYRIQWSYTCEPTCIKEFTQGNGLTTQNFPITWYLFLMALPRFWLNSLMHDGPETSCHEHSALLFQSNFSSITSNSLCYLLKNPSPICLIVLLWCHFSKSSVYCTIVLQGTSWVYDKELQSTGLQDA